MNKKKIVTKEKIRKYLYSYKRLNSIIKARELKRILEKDPSFQEWQERKNTVEEQSLNLISDRKLQEMRFYKKQLDIYLNVLKVVSKESHNYLLDNYILRDRKENKIVNSKKLDNEIINYLYENLYRESIKHEKKNKKYNS